MDLKLIKRNFYAGTYVYLYAAKNRYWKICVDKPMPKIIQVFKQDLRSNKLSNYLFKGEFKNLKQAKQFIKEAA
tara:strand:- start:1944 stop:2165 length:222 start_codon:yes stop_codon:yes gene_type:complete